MTKKLIRLWLRTLETLADELIMWALTGLMICLFVLASVLVFPTALLVDGYAALKAWSQDEGDLPEAR